MEGPAVSVARVTPFTDIVVAAAGDTIQIVGWLLVLAAAVWVVTVVAMETRRWRSR